ncbi:unnamed protein product [Rangifer tarandus platyrhynchus]|uniref:Uncharacterized protein n=1 Tax=Rangifer tarandus platyrhynchus TaxID=3082113 RepID=A0ABN8Y6D7_RANTA|nr:unnamed protein product [Rangifer tarandus platyrhynchus]
MSQSLAAEAEAIDAPQGCGSPPGSELGGPGEPRVAGASGRPWEPAGTVVSPAPEQPGPRESWRTVGPWPGTAGVCREGGVLRR